MLKIKIIKQKTATKRKIKKTRKKIPANLSANPTSSGLRDKRKKTQPMPRKKKKRIKRKKINKRRKRPVQLERFATSLTFLLKRPKMFPNLPKKKKKRSSLSLRKKKSSLSLKRRKSSLSSKRKKNNLSSKRKRKRAYWTISNLPLAKKFPKTMKFSRAKRN